MSSMVKAGQAVKPAFVSFSIMAMAAAGLAAIHYDRVDWDERMVGMINVELVPTLKPDCAEAVLIEVAPGATAGSMKYRCGGTLYPFFQSGESVELAKVWNGHD